MSNADELHWEEKQSKRIIKKYETNTPGSDDDECEYFFYDCSDFFEPFFLFHFSVLYFLQFFILNFLSEFLF